MTFGLGWKYNGEVFIVADTALSSFDLNENVEGISSFGEHYGKYENSIVEEKGLKLIRLNESSLVTYSGDVKAAMDAIGTLKVIIEGKITDSLESLWNNFQTHDNFELLIATKGNENSLYHFDNKNGFTEVQNIKGIGNGAENPEIFNPVIEFLVQNEQCTEDSEFLLVKMVSFLQCYSLKNHLFRMGVGGAFFGARLKEKIVWCNDLLYIIYSNDLLAEDKNMVSVISRYNGIASASGFDGLNKYFLNIGTDKEFYNSDYLHNVVGKILGSGYPDYLIVYSPFINNMFIFNTNKRVYNSVFNMYVKKFHHKTDYAFTFNSDFVKKANSNGNNSHIPYLTQVLTIPTNYTPREKLISEANLASQVKDNHEIYDIDLREINNSLGYTIDESMTTFIERYNFVIIIDVNYFYKKLIDTYEYYKGVEIDFKNIRLETLVKEYLYDIDHEKLDKYGIILITQDQQKYIYNDFDFLDWLTSYKNSFVVSFDRNFSYYDYLKCFLFEYFKNFYHNEKYFHLMRNYIMQDSEEINEVLELTPKFNTDPSQVTDIIVIRNYNNETNVYGEYMYIVMDNLIEKMFELTPAQIALWDPIEQKLTF